MRPLLTAGQGRALRALTHSLSQDRNRLAKMDRQIPLLVVESFDISDWASLTFAGQRHRIIIRVPCPIGDVALTAALIEPTDIDLTGQIVAEVRVVVGVSDAAGVSLTFEVLTIDNRP